MDNPTALALSGQQTSLATLADQINQEHAACVSAADQATSENPSSCQDVAIGEIIGDSPRWEDCLYPPEACQKCRERVDRLNRGYENEVRKPFVLDLLFWWDVLGGRHCLFCDPPTLCDDRLRKLYTEIHRLFKEALKRTGKRWPDS